MWRGSAGGEALRAVLLLAILAAGAAVALTTDLPTVDQLRGRVADAGLLGWAAVAGAPPSPSWRRSRGPRWRCSLASCSASGRPAGRRGRGAGRCAAGLRARAGAGARHAAAAGRSPAAEGRPAGDGARVHRRPARPAHPGAAVLPGQLRRRAVRRPAAGVRGRHLRGPAARGGVQRGRRLGRRRAGGVGPGHHDRAGRGRAGGSRGRRWRRRGRSTRSRRRARQP